MNKLVNEIVDFMNNSLKNENNPITSEEFINLYKNIQNRISFNLFNIKYPKKVS